jgi:hypothetical protein
MWTELQYGVKEEASLLALLKLRILPQTNILVG